MEDNNYYKILKTIVVSGGMILNSMRGKTENKPKESDLPPELVKESSIAHTDVDDLVQDIALEILYSHLPDIAINAEEDTERVKWFKKDKTGFCFHLDPLDGTLAYTKNRDDFAIGAAFSDSLEFKISAIYFPARDLLYYAEKGKGIKVTNGLGEEIPFNRPKTPERKFAQKRCDEYLPILEAMNMEKLDSMSAHHSMISLVEGKASIQLYHMASPHDFGIPKVILEEVGGICTDLEGNPIKFNEEFSRVPYFLAFFNKEIKEEFFSKLNKS
ncbi:MAG: inositol monophosphatase family protein [Candidatus Heimdallarchaeaceae archaeon]